MKRQEIFAAFSLIGAIGAGLIGVGAPTPALAQDPAYMSCDDFLVRAQRDLRAQRLLLQYRPRAVRVWRWLFSTLRAAKRLG